MNKVVHVPYISEILERFYYVKTSFGSDLVLETVHLLSETFLKPKLVFSFILLKPKPVFKTIETTSRGSFVDFVCPNNRCSQKKNGGK